MIEIMILFGSAASDIVEAPDSEVRKVGSSWSMIFSENRYPSRIKAGTGFFGIMLWRPFPSKMAPQVVAGGAKLRGEKRLSAKRP
jgi:hypothetical protein